MSRFWPQAEYAEDQKFSRSILTTHVVYRAFQTGTVIGTTYTLLAATYLSFRPRTSTTPMLTPTTPASKSTSTPRTVMPSLTRALIRGSAMGSLYGAGITAVALPFYMRGQTDVQWRDRAWRLLVNEGQVEVDDFSLVGMGVGALTALGRKSGKEDGLRKTRAVVVSVVGRAGLGGLAGVVVYMGWRYGVMKGQRKESQI